MQTTAYSDNRKSSRAMTTKVPKHIKEAALAKWRKGASLETVEDQDDWWT
jgi:hypothetical protein